MATVHATSDRTLGLPGIATVRERYRALYEQDRQRGPAPGPFADEDGPLPPYACRLLNRGEPVDRARSGLAAHLGTSLGDVMTVGGLRCATGVASELLETVNLSGYRPVLPDRRTVRLLTDAVESLPDVWPRAADAVTTFTSLVVWLAPRPHHTPVAGGFASRTLSGMPFTTFLTDLAARRLPPGFAFPEPSRYALQEALYTEALHQWLNEGQRTEDLFVPGPEGRTSLVHVPWYASWWTAARCMHALFVYTHVAPMRAAAAVLATGPERELLAHAARSAPSCAWGLLDGLVSVRHVLSPAGAALLDRLHRLLIEDSSEPAHRIDLASVPKVVGSGRC